MSRGELFVWQRYSSPVIEKCSNEPQYPTKGGYAPHSGRGSHLHRSGRQEVFTHHDVVTAARVLRVLLLPLTPFSPSSPHARGVLSSGPVKDAQGGRACLARVRVGARVGLGLGLGLGIGLRSGSPFFSTTAALTRTRTRTRPLTPPPHPSPGRTAASG